MRDNITTLTDEALSDLLWMVGPTPLLSLLPQRIPRVTRAVVTEDQDLSAYTSLRYVRVEPLVVPQVITEQEGEVVDNDRISEPVLVVRRVPVIGSGILLPPSVTHVDLVGTASLHIDQNYESITHLTSERSYSHQYDGEGYMEALGLIRSSMILDSGVGDLRLELSGPYRYREAHEYTHSLTLVFAGNVDLTNITTWRWPPNLTALSIVTRWDIPLSSLLAEIPSSVKSLSFSGGITEQTCTIPSQVTSLTIHSTKTEWTGNCLTLPPSLTYLEGVHKLSYSPSLSTLVYHWPVTANFAEYLHGALDLHCSTIDEEARDLCRTKGIALYYFNETSKDECLEQEE